MSLLAIPWVALAIGIGFMSLKGWRAKREYLAQKRVRDVETRAAESLVARLADEEHRREIEKSQEKFAFVVGR
jgi:hypothetical protein